MREKPEAEVKRVFNIVCKININIFADIATMETGPGGEHDREARTAEEVNAGRGMDGGRGMSLRGSLRSKLAPLLGNLACARLPVTARRAAR